VEISVAAAADDATVTVVAPVGEIDNEAAPELEARIKRELEQGRCRLVLDFSGVTYLNSAGVGVVAMSAKRARSRGGDSALAGLKGRVRRAIELVGLDKVMIVGETAEEACARLGPPGAPDQDG